MFVKNEDISLTDLGGGVSRKVLAYDKNLMSVEVRFEKGAVGAMHTHPHTQISYVLAGKFEANIDGEIKVIEKNDGIRIYEEGQQVNVVIDPRDIMAYPAGVHHEEQ